MWYVVDGPLRQSQDKIAELERGAKSAEESDRCLGQDDNNQNNCHVLRAHEGSEERGERREERGQRTEDRGHRRGTEDKGQRTEDRGQSPAADHPDCGRAFERA